MGVGAGVPDSPCRVSGKQVCRWVVEDADPYIREKGVVNE